MHAGDRLEVGLWLGRISGVRPVDAQPVHLTAARDLLRPDHGDVVLGLASDNAGIAADAGVEIDRHAPGMPVVTPFRIERGRGCRIAGRVSLVGADDAVDVLSRHRMVLLGRDQRHASGKTPDGAADDPRLGGGAQPICVEADDVLRCAREHPAVAERQRHCARSLTRQQPDWCRERARCGPNLDEVAVPEPKHRSGVGRNQGGIAPDLLGEGPRELLEPGILGEAAIPHGRIGGEHNVERRGWGWRRGRAIPVRAQGHGHGRKGGAGNHAGLKRARETVGERFAPGVAPCRRKELAPIGFLAADEAQHLFGAEARR